MHSFEKLIGEHKAIAVRADALTHVCKGSCDAGAAYRALRTLADVLAGHLATEDIDIYPQLILSNDEGAASAARESIAQFASLAADWIRYVARWTARAIGDDWRRFVGDTAEILNRLARRIRTENELLYPMALRAAHIRLRD